ncbi:hypothetical protein O6H91_16G048500 [Diphasiastrum complanatum]|uniref:Uncharacterized protein n=1 Tax=Diphasiastrum complanatum TaxID=34168 RepID=A0ACC2BC24_DIPCM|nr:hypothetical protein O6H91_16G048500 [Diphasiastrum complanatum]
MEATKVINVQGKPDLWLPPGFRFHPTDDELISFYLTGKVLNSSFAAHAIAEVDLNKYEPWDLPEKANIGEKEWYFFTLRDRKYPTGMRTNRATMAGYWKATGKDRDVISSRTSSLAGMKKTLVFYRGRAPRGEKTNWIMHEYRLEGKAGALSSLKTTKEWVVCRIFKKKAGAKKHMTVQTDKDVSYSGGSEPPSPVAGRYHRTGTENADEVNWYNDQASCITKHECEDLENREYLPGNAWNYKEGASFLAPSDNIPNNMGSIVKTSLYPDILGNGSLSITGKISSFAQDFIPSHCSAPYSNTASKQVIDNHTNANSLIKSCKLEPYYNPSVDQSLTTSTMTEIINSWMGETMGYDYAGIRQLPPLQLPPPIESSMETDVHTNENTSNSHRFLRYHSDPSSGMVELGNFYRL